MHIIKFAFEMVALLTLVTSAYVLMIIVAVGMGAL